MKARRRGGSVTPAEARLNMVRFGEDIGRWKRQAQKAREWLRCCGVAAAFIYAPPQLPSALSPRDARCRSRRHAQARDMARR